MHTAMSLISVASDTDFVTLEYLSRVSSYYRSGVKLSIGSQHSFEIAGSFM